MPGERFFNEILEVNRMNDFKGNFFWLRKDILESELMVKSFNNKFHSIREHPGNARLK